MKSIQMSVNKIPLLNHTDELIINLRATFYAVKTVTLPPHAHSKQFIWPIFHFIMNIRYFWGQLI